MDPGAARKAGGGPAGDQARATPIDERLEQRMGKDVERIAFFSDAVFAIAITLLTVRLAVPAATTHIGAALRHEAPHYFSFALSFWVIGSFWMAHHRMFRFIRRYDADLLRVNLLLLAAVAFLPFPTEVVGGWGNETPAVVLYAATIVVCGVALSLIWLVADRHGLLEPDLPRVVVTYYGWRGVIGFLPFLVSIPVAFVSPVAALAMWGLLLVVRPVERRLLRRRLGPFATWL
jgi:uncharacterized membrane protein